jgi:hypothetical protein
MMDANRSTPAEIDVSRVSLLLVGVLMTLLALVIVAQAVQRGPTSVLFYLAAIGAVIWIVSGRSAWWVPVPLTTALGGLIWVGFRIYTHEMAVLLALASLIPTIALQKRALIQDRDPAPFAIKALFIYLSLHLLASLMIQYTESPDFIKMGSIFRTYLGGLWGIGFVLLFQRNGSTRIMKIVLMLIYVLLGLRILIGLYTYYFPGLIFFRTFSVFLVLSEHGAMDLRGAPLAMMTLAFGYLSRSRTPLMKLLHVGIIVACEYVMLIGGSRVSAAMGALLPLIWMIINRHYFLVALGASALVSAFVLVNLNPTMLEPLPYPVQRALSIFVIGERLDVQADQRGSNLWHAELFKEGRDRWLRNLGTIIFGNRIYPFDEAFYSPMMNFYYRLKVAADTARYERSLWTILTTSGLVGGVLFAVAFWKLMRDPARELFRRRIVDVASMVYFIAFVQVSLWLLFIAVSGGFPGSQLMWAGLAYAVWQDEQRARAQAAAPAPAAAPRRHRALMVG